MVDFREIVSSIELQSVILYSSTPFICCCCYWAGHPSIKQMTYCGDLLALIYCSATSKQPALFKAALVEILVQHPPFCHARSPIHKHAHPSTYTTTRARTRELTYMQVASYSMAE